jgi:predicted extracellular nuclease
MSVFPPRRCAYVVAPALVLGGVLLGVTAASAASSSVLINEVYGGGGNSGAAWSNDFVELFNKGDATVDLDGWQLQYWSATATTGAKPSGTTSLSGSIKPGGHFLIQEAAGANTSAGSLPGADVTGSIGMSGSGARVAVVDASGATVDLLGWGGAAVSEGNPAPATTNTTSSTRNNTCVDTDDNLADFSSVAATPQNAATPHEDCVAPPPVAQPTIAAIQGSSHLSPLANKPVAHVPGIVTVLGPQGFWMQSAAPDDDPGTSEGVYVFTRRAPTVAVGDSVTVNGTVTEFRPGGASGNDNTTTTEIVSPLVTITGSGVPLPAPVVLGVDRTAPQQTVEADNPLNVEGPRATYRPETDAIDFYESLEGMRVGLRDAQVVGPTAPFGEIPVVPGTAVAATRSTRGGVVYGGYDQPNTARVQLDDALLPAGSMPAADVGDRIRDETVGVLDYSFSNYKLELTQAPQLAAGGLRREVTAPQGNNELAVATFNVENLDPSDPQSKFDRLAAQVVTNLQSPDILAMEEIQDDNGATNDGTVDSSATVAKLTAAIRAAGGPAYEARWINPSNGTDGGEPGGNIRQVFLFRPDRGVRFVDRPGGTATASTGVYTQGHKAHLTSSPGRINPTSPAWASSRKPLAGEFTFRGATVFAIANHFASKGGDDPLFGRWQQPVRASEVQRVKQATEVRAFLDTLLDADASAKVVVLGDINDFEFSPTVDTLVGAQQAPRRRLVDLPRTLKASERYSYVYEGNSQVLDHILVTPALTRAPHGWKHRAYEYDIVHTNSEFHDQDSDHDPQVARLAIRPGKG